MMFRVTGEHSPSTLTQFFSNWAAALSDVTSLLGCLSVKANIKGTYSNEHLKHQKVEFFVMGVPVKERGFSGDMMKKGYVHMIE